MHTPSLKQSSYFGSMSRLGTCPNTSNGFLCYTGRMEDERALDPIEGRIRNHLAVVLEAAGVNDDFIKKLVQRTDEGLDAQRTTRIKVKDSLGRDVIETFHDVDHGRRLGAVDRAVDLATRAGKVPAQFDARRGASTTPPINVNITILSRGGDKKIVSINSEADQSGAVTGMSEVPPDK